MTINTAELRLVLKEIEARPESWDQRSWARRMMCGTTFCFAGHVVARSPEYKIVWNGGSTACSCRNEQGHEELIFDVAQRILGLDYDQAAALFRGSNDLDDLRNVVERLCAEAEEGETT